jgi:SAM-dependent methyltransferase
VSTDHEWELWGSRDPYYGVLTNPKFRSDVLTAEAKEEFFYSGRCHVDYVIAACRLLADPSFVPDRVLDFGCGVGRLLVPFAGVAREVVGMDISPSMLSEARRNCDERGAGGVVLMPSDDQLSAAEGGFDLVHSCIVLQHIELPRGRDLFSKLVDKVSPGGFGALHVTYAWDIFASTFGQPPAPVPAPPPPPPDSLGVVKARLKKLLRGRDVEVASQPAPLTNGEKRDPEMQMNYYDVNELLFIIQRAGASQIRLDFTDHGGALGAFFFFRKPA